MSKVSRYNHFQLWQDGYYIAYNARSGAVALMTEENYATYRRIAEKLAASPSPELSASEQELLKQLEYGRFVYADDSDEYEAIKFQHNLSRYDQSTLGLVVAPTMACNMACAYCYEANKKGRMSAQTIEVLVAFIEQRASGLKQLEMGWYGGEPLLAMDIIEDLSQTIFDLAEEHKFEYGSSIVSNGYLLTPNVVDKLRDLKVNSVQVTLDGPARLHNEKRPLKNGRESFDTIVQNLKHAVTKMSVGVRVNVDKTFTSDIIAELLNELDAAGLRERVGVYFGLLEPASTACANVAENCYDTIDFSRIETEYYRLLLDKGFIIQKIPSPLATYCMAQNINSFLIDPDGYFYRCWNHVGDRSMSFGRLGLEVNYQHPNFLRLFAYSPFEDETCRSCELLPVCMGGCPARRTDRDLRSEEMCESWRHNLQPMLETIARSRQQRAQRAAKAQGTAPATKE